MSKTRLYYGDKCFYRCPYLSTEKFADVGLRAEYHAYCHLSGEPVELTLKGNDAIRTSECKAYAICHDLDSTRLYIWKRRKEREALESISRM